jgi:hypothetical protein
MTPVDVISQADRQVTAAGLELTSSDDLPEMLLGLGVLDQLLGHLRDTRSVLNDRIAKTMSDDTAEFPGGVAERRWGKPRTQWRNDELSSHVSRLVADRHAVNPSTGELDTELDGLLLAAVEDYAVLARPAWRTRNLRALGVDPDEWCHTEPARATVTVSLGQSEGSL